MSPRPSLRLSFRLSSRLSLAAAAAALVTTAASCTDEPDAPEGPGVLSTVAKYEVPLTTNREIDLLFVIDNSPRMASQRAKMLANYRSFMAALEAYPGGMPDLHIGVVTTDLGTRAPGEIGPGRSVGTGAGSCSADGDRGELRRAPAVEGNFISDIVQNDGTRARNYAGSLADAFTQLADVGSAGCAYARPLEAARRALSRPPANEGFLRPSASLGIVLLTDDEDCSFGSSLFVEDNLDRSRCTTEPGALMPVGEYAAFFKSLKSDPNKVVVLGGFAPPSAPACTDVRPAARLDALLAAFPSRSQAISICEPDLGELMKYPMLLLKVTLGGLCTHVPLLDTDPAAEGLQAECAAWYSYLDNDGVPSESLIPDCRDDASGPCWHIGPSPQNCSGVGDHAIEVRNPRRYGSKADSRFHMECVATDL